MKHHSSEEKEVMILEKELELGWSHLSQMVVMVPPHQTGLETEELHLLMEKEEEKLLFGYGGFFQP
ncbi:hypothetical protein H5410_039063 [Solanum commersonii]|uniref:Uncharacterized protein n=1 Tax=Solanum commersonii TaxID=4109 RepID=A0A9J5YD79_SOLCO|nr:hypothetical protein H5410_039063 [Solanum commersonii]